MDFHLSTNWNADRHAAGEAMIDEILSLGFSGVEIGYRLTEIQAGGVRQRVATGQIKVGSVHAYAPCPIGMPAGHPELYLLASPDEDERAMAIVLLQRTLAFSAELGARAVVVHAGRIPVKPSSAELIEAAEEDGPQSKRYVRLLQRNQARRARHAGRHLDAFCRSLDLLLPRCAELNLALCLENLPSWEAIPTESEMLELKQRYPTPSLAYWHDLGHGQVRENLGWIRHRECAEALLPHTAGLHIHDVLPPAGDHLPPPLGKLPFEAFAFYGSVPVLRVFEPEPRAPAAALVAGLKYMQQAWA